MTATTTEPTSLTAEGDVTGLQQADQFLSVLFQPDDLVELRPIECWQEGGNKKHHVANDKRRWLKPAEVLQHFDALNHLSDAPRFLNPYFGVCPRPANGAGKKEDIEIVRTLWADIDNVAPHKAMYLIAEAGLPRASMLVCSGHGTHAYWILSKAVEVTSAAVRDRVENIMSRMRKPIGGDATQDLSRILRLPGTLNVKDGRNGAPASSVYLVELNEHRYTLDEIEEYLPEPEPAEATSDEPTDDEDDGQALTEEDRAYVRDNLTPDSEDRSKDDFRVVCELLRRGFGRSAIQSAVSCYSKFATRNGEYFKSTYDKAAKAVRDNPGRPAGAASTNIIEHPDPLRLAERAIDSRWRAADRTLTRRRHRGAFWQFVAPCYQELSDEGADAELYGHMDTLWTLKRDKDGQPEQGADGKPKLVKIVPRSNLIREVRLALPSRGLLVDDRADPPVWLDGHQGPDPRELLPFANGLLHLPTRTLYPNTPKLFSVNGLLYRYDPEAPPPEQWLKFLEQLWPDDGQAILTLQEWVGYCLTPWTALEKILLLVGPKRSGKGTIGRVMTALLGIHNVAGPTLAGLAQNFGLQELLNKLLAIISDARLSGRTDQATVVERLLTISGEDPITIDRKHRDPMTVTLPTRIMLCTNELPRLTDSSGALASRFLVLKLQESFYGREDHELTGRLLTELPGIMLWALDGWERLKDRGRFEQPESSDEAIRALEDLGSPIGAFVRDCCIVGAGQCVDVDVLFNGWRAWCADTGREKPGTVQVFGRDLAAAVPGLKKKRPASDGERYRQYEGIGLSEHGTVLASRPHTSAVFSIARDERM